MQAQVPVAPVPTVEPAGPPAPSHNIAVFFHGFFKVSQGLRERRQVLTPAASRWSNQLDPQSHSVQVAAIVWYWICGLTGTSFVINFVVCIVLLAMDFWVVSVLTAGS